MNLYRKSCIFLLLLNHISIKMKYFLCTGIILRTGKTQIAGFRMQFLLTVGVTQNSLIDSVKVITQIKNQMHSFSYHELNLLLNR